MIILCRPPRHRCDIRFSCICMCSRIHVVVQNCVTPIYSSWCKGRSTGCITMLSHSKSIGWRHKPYIAAGSCMSSKFLRYSMYALFIIYCKFCFNLVINKYHFNGCKVYSSGSSMSCRG